MSTDPKLEHIAGSAGARRHFRYFDYMMVAFVAILLLSNLIGASKQSVVDMSGVAEALPWLPWHWILTDNQLLFGAGILILLMFRAARVAVFQSR